MKAILMLESGKSFSGESSGVCVGSIGEIVFNTAVVGYQEMMTDPANAGKILVLTYPLIGNYGIAPKFNESKKVWLSGLVIKEKSRIRSNWQSQSGFDDFIKEHNLTVISGVDTRSLAVYIRQKGQMLGIISSKEFDTKNLLSRIDDFRKKKAEDFLSKISVKRPVSFGKKAAKLKVAILDLGVAHSTIRQLETLGFSIRILPYVTSAQEILRLKPDGLIISNGPEQDPGLEQVVGTVKQLINRLPILGISTGHQALAEALGAKVIKMQLGHHGVNYPMYTPKSYKGEITAQNHSYVVDADSLAKIKDVKITGYNLNDRTVEEFESIKLKLAGIQYYPVSPGLNEVNPIFHKFKKMLERSK